MRILFLHPTPGLGRQKSYSEVCRLLQKQGHEAVLVYNGPVVDGLHSEVPVAHFETWYAASRQLVERTDPIELERRYPKSNLYLGVVSERRISNYSLLDGTYPHVSYTYEEVNHLTKALVLFYEALLARYQSEVVFAQHPDNIHSAILFEMLRSRPQRALLIFPDYYWSIGTNFLFDSKYFKSSRMVDAYHRYVRDYDTVVKPREELIRTYLVDRNQKDPSLARPELFPRVSILKSLRDGFEVIRAGRSRIFFRRPGIVEGYGQVYFWASVRAFFQRHRFAIGLRHSNLLADSLPSEPFVFFPLQRVPEAAMLSRATSYLNQQGLIQALSASLPSGYKLVLKDHPRSTGIHPASFYGKLLELPNVVVLKPGFSNDEVLAKTALLVTIAGTLGYQQLMRGKPVVMFGRKFYEVLEGVIRVNDMNQLPYVLKDILLFGKHIPDPVTMRRSLFAYIAMLLDHKFEADGDPYDLHFKPQALADLVGQMLALEEAEPLPDITRDEED